MKKTKKYLHTLLIGGKKLSFKENKEHQWVVTFDGREIGDIAPWEDAETEPAVLFADEPITRIAWWDYPSAEQLELMSIVLQQIAVQVRLYNQEYGLEE